MPKAQPTKAAVKMLPDEMAMEILKLKQRAATKGLWKTVRALDEAARIIGWELAALTGEQP